MPVMQIIKCTIFLIYLRTFNLLSFVCLFAKTNTMLYYNVTDLALALALNVQQTTCGSNTLKPENAWPDIQ